jgi:hypothetical protein
VEYNNNQLHLGSWTGKDPRYVSRIRDKGQDTSTKIIFFVYIAANMSSSRISRAIEHTTDFMRPE